MAVPSTTTSSDRRPMSEKKRVWDVISPVYSQSSASFRSRPRTSAMISSLDTFMLSLSLLGVVEGSGHHEVALTGRVRDQRPSVHGRQARGHLAAQAHPHGAGGRVEVLGH